MVIFAVAATFGDVLSAPREGPNALAGEASLYLRLHANNPVNWYPWGEAAFQKARDENKPILLSIGYSTCHWCHVMERESFENEDIAKRLNEQFVCIKLDREERPDVDNVYMRAFQAATGQGGGWPLNVFLTPELELFTGGTYFPPEPRDGLPGFAFVIDQIAKSWADDEAAIRETSSSMREQMQTFFNAAAGEGEAKAAAIVAEVMKGADRAHGGFGETEKFPQVSTLRMLLASGDLAARRFVLKTCDAMLRGGIYDHVGGGFHRYTVDRDWQIPHFEKMLYDQAQLVELYVEAWQITKNPAYERAARETADFVLRDMTLENGAFGAALDAQSEGKEGKFYCWTMADLEALLDESEVAMMKGVFAIQAEGNFSDHSDPEPLKQQNVLYYRNGQSWSPEVGGVLKKLAASRRGRVHPAFDKKAMASWNGLMIGALVRAAHAFDEPRYLDAAERAHAKLWEMLWDEDAQRLAHCENEGEVQASAQASSVGMYLHGSLKLYSATLGADYLKKALQLAAFFKSEFYDEDGGGFYESAARDDVVLRMKGEFDGAIPTASSVGFDVFSMLHQLTGDEKFAQIAEKTADFHLSADPVQAQAYGEMLRVKFAADAGKARLVIAAGDGDVDAFQKIVAGEYRPGLIVMGNERPVADFEAGLPAKDGKLTAYLCVGQTCDLPVTEPAALEKLLQKTVTSAGLKLGE